MQVFDRWGLRPQTAVPTTVGGVALQPRVFGKWGMCPQTQWRRFGGGAARPGCHHFGVTPYYEV